MYWNPFYECFASLYDWYIICNATDNASDATDATPATHQRTASDQRLCHTHTLECGLECIPSQ